MQHPASRTHQFPVSTRLSEDRSGPAYIVLLTGAEVTFHLWSIWIPFKTALTDISEHIVNLRGILVLLTG